MVVTKERKTRALAVVLLCSGCASLASASNNRWSNGPQPPPPPLSSPNGYVPQQAQQQLSQEQDSQEQPQKSYYNNANKDDAFAITKEEQQYQDDQRYENDSQTRGGEEENDYSQYDTADGRTATQDLGVYHQSSATRSSDNIYEYDQWNDKDNYNDDRFTTDASPSRQRHQQQQQQHQKHQQQHQQQQQHQHQQRDPPKYEPIHYNFPKDKKDTEKRGFFGRRKQQQHQQHDQKRIIQERGRRREGPSSEGRNSGSRPPFLEDDGIPETSVSPYNSNNNGKGVGGEDIPGPQQRYPGEGRNGGEPEFASARRDVVTKYQSTAKGKLSLALSCAGTGAIVGAFLGKSLFNNPIPVANTCLGIFLLCSILRNPYGELVRALGMAVILALQRTTSIRRRYPTWVHIKSSFGIRPRRNFPPSSNPWNYQPRDKRDPEFRMLFTLIAMSFVGSTCGGSLPLIPTWMGSLAGAGFLGLSSTLQSARGDLARTMGMRVVALCEEMLGINSELEILRKGGVAAEKILDKIFILDRKHRIKDRLISGATFLYGQGMAQVNRVQSEMNRPPEAGRGNGRDGRSDQRDDRDRRRGRDDDRDRRRGRDWRDDRRDDRDRPDGYGSRDEPRDYRDQRGDSRSREGSRNQDPRKPEHGRQQQGI